ncbi:M20/M25/M40 family metallo-hydrolase [Microvirga sp. STS02]|uniref:M20/M25/M40 family metallo-hydrolase n=1 Tax=Hymenobacter negativus TaxID=2795026 RepID=UPI0018DD44CA|nr:MULTISPECIES: M20/M25/M40 family metallo-hydrolase [Bacteria]MBH8569616.1 M20/M25/M40 family metallo-hydrolase [Hymenobacter negativus]MBR7209352.1 M20/M25/M40 family metallo-hydrolase [Microvirga sp. STS02]
MKQMLLLGAMLATVPAIAQKKAAKPAPKAASVSSATVTRVIQTLAADDMQGRGTGQPGGLKAAQFLAAEFKRIGLKPLPGQANFEQTLTVYQGLTSPVAAVINDQTLAPLQAVAISGEPTLRWTSEDAQPPAVVVIGPEPTERGKLFSYLRPKANTLVFVDTAQAKVFRQLAGYVAKGTTSAEQPKPFSTVFVLGPKPATLTYRISASSVLQPVELRNIVGMLPAHDPKRAKENVVFSGHYDHLGYLKPVAGDSIANGADDDASGTTAVVALAEYFKKKNDNARPLIFVAFAAEEVGGFGSQLFSKQLDPQQVAAMFNIEMIGKEAKFGPNTAFITGYERSDFGKLLQANLAGSKFRFEPDPYPEQNLFYRSDNATLARLGVPAHTISTDQIPMDGLYHSVDDEVESLSLGNMTAVIQAIAQSASGIVSGKQTPTRIPPLTDDNRR